MSIAEQVITQVQEMVAPLESADRLRIIEAIVTAPAKLKPPAQTNDPATRADKDVLEIEQAAWFAKPAQLRRQYQGQFVAIHDRQVVDSDTDKRELYIRVRERYGSTPVLILSADLENIPVFRIHSPQLERENGTSL